ncbi:unnamed protein product [Symbiodinium natans]|uniref:Ubiquitin-like domain-containing protein n=1 Tax=Symbiodinium natans TaxID=878477 RepID=A0A812RF19_9DINO|nr:unnamed protein product [Symbiodinium natans]
MTQPWQQKAPRRPMMWRPWWCRFFTSRVTIGTLEPRSMWPALTCLAQWGIGVVAAALETRVSAVPAFPCHEDGLCTPDSRRCDRHKKVLFVKIVAGSKIDKTVEIPYGDWEVGLWYRCRAHEATGLPIRRLKLLFAGAALPDGRRHSGLQVRSTLHLVVPAKEALEKGLSEVLAVGGPEALV